MNFTDGIQLHDEHQEYLRYLNDKAAATKLGGVIFVGILMVVGVIGNLHVLYIYAFRFKRSTHRVYILCLAMVDTVTCCIGMPFVIIDLQYPLMFNADVVCKTLRFLNYFMCSGSAIILIVIAVDRYKNICHPFEPQMTEQRAMIACAISLFIALCLSWPAPVLYGVSSVNSAAIAAYLHIEVKVNITGTRCFTEDKYFRTPYQAIFNIVLIAVIIILGAVLIVLYSLICNAMILHVRKLSKFSKNVQTGVAFNQRSQGPLYVMDGPRSPSENVSSNDSSGTYSESLSNSQSSELKCHGPIGENQEKKATETQFTDNCIQTVSSNDTGLSDTNGNSFPVERFNENLQADDKIQSDNVNCNGGTASELPMKDTITRNTGQSEDAEENIGSDIADEKKTWMSRTQEHEQQSNVSKNHQQELENNKSELDVKDTVGVTNKTDKQNNENDDGLKFKFSDIPVVANVNDNDKRNERFSISGENSENRIQILKAVPKVEKKWDTQLKPRIKDNSKREKQARRITLMLLIITVVFILSFIPHLSLKTIAFVRKNFITNLSYTELFLYNTFVWSFFINNMANPIIYGFCDSTFRKEIRKTYRKIFRKLPLRKRKYTVK